MASKSRTAFTLALLALFVMSVSVQATHPSGVSPTTHNFSRINAVHKNPTGMDVVIIPPGYVSWTAMVLNTGWTSDPLYDHPATQAILEAAEYWEWMINQYEGTYPQLQYLTYEITVLGVDAGVDDLNDAEIIINTAMAGDLTGFVFHLGLGLPTFPPAAFLNPGGAGMEICTTWLTGWGSENNDIDPYRVRNLAIHEFGHCLGVGHTGGEEADGSVCNVHGTCYDPPSDGGEEDVMSSVFGSYRQCLSNLNIQSIAEGYDFAPNAWNVHDTEVYQDQDDYGQTCMPSSLERF